MIKHLERKIPPPIVAILCMLLMKILASAGPSIALNQTANIGLCGIFVVSALYFDLSAIFLFLKRKTTINPLPNGQSSSLVTDGIYKITRNPMYVGLVFFLLAWLVYLNSLAPALGVVVFIFFIRQFQIIPEEKALTETFGESFIHYKKNTARWLIV